MRLTPLLTAAIAFAAAPLGIEAQEQFALSGDEVSIYNLAGSVSVVAGTGSDVVIEVTRGGDDGAQLDVETGTIRGRNTLRVIYPSDDIVYSELGRGSSTDVRVNRDGTFYGDGGRRGRKVQVRGSGRGLEAFADLVIRVPAGRSIAIYLAAGESDATGLDGDLLFDVGSGRTSVTDIRGSVLVDSGSGRVVVENVQGDEVNIDTGSGSVEVGRIRTDDLSIDTGSGSVSGTGLVAGRLNVDTGSGRIDLSGVESADVVCDTGSGRVELQFDSDVDRLSVDTGSGGITVTVPENAGAAFEMDTGGGRIDLDVPVTLQESERTYARGALGDGVGNIQLDTGSGSIRLTHN